MNTADIVILCLVGVAVFFALKHIIKQSKRCKTVGCQQCSRSGNCIHQKMSRKKNKKK